MNKYCRNCGKELNEEQNVCLNCGVNVTNTTNTTKTSESTDKNAAVGLILGLISIVAWLLPLFGYPVTICGIVFSSKGLKSNTNKGKAIAGLVLSIVFLIVTLLNSLLGVLMMLDSYYYY